ncbi:MAG: 1-acyl-sn-glycerol-3-phosphate acyltransferase [Frankiales bacterium]|jgi:1-acyl-sn-glycerol-3-phosphate acyltransferase|nr:1-acyl-sn-glycerol-3-phosphate acyltransferase [Frankiales bacterium]
MVEPVYTPVIALAKAVFRGLGIKFHVTGVENVPRTGGAVMAINHVGYLDFTFAGLATQPAGRLVRFMAKKEVFDHPVSGPLMRGMKHIPVDRTGAAAESYKLAVDAVSRGEIVGVFPEATISQSYELKEFKTGAARMALQAGVPLLPCVIWGSQRIFTKGRPRDLTRGTDVRIVVGAPFTPAPGADPVQVTAELKARMQTLLEEALATYRGGPRSPGDDWWVPASRGGSAPTPEQAREIARRQTAERVAKRAAKRAAKSGDA